MAMKHRHGGKQPKPAQGQPSSPIRAREQSRTTLQASRPHSHDFAHDLEPIGNALPDIVLRLELQEALNIHREALQDFVRITETPHESWGVQEVKRLQECRRIAAGILPEYQGTGWEIYRAPLEALKT